MLQGLPLAQVKAGNTSEDLLNEICQITYSLLRAKEITKKGCNDMINSIKLWDRMDTIFMNSENSKTSDPHRLLLSLSDKVNLTLSRWGILSSYPVGRGGGGLTNLPELIFPRRNCAVGMKLCIYNNYHKNFWFSSKNLHGCADGSIFSAYVSKNRHFSSFLLATLNVSQFGPKYDTDYSDCTNMFLEGEIK